MGKLQINGGLKVQGRVVGSGDDEGIVVDYASNNYAALTLGSPSAQRSVFYLTSAGSAFWRYNNGTTSYDIGHPGKSGTIAVTSDLTWNSIANKPNLVYKRDQGYAYNALSSYYCAGSTPTYYRITIPDTQLNIWSMLTIELLIKQNYDSGTGGKIIINAYHSTGDWVGFTAYIDGYLTTNIKVYGSDQKYFYIAGCSSWSTIHLSKMIVSDGAVNVDLTDTSLDFVTSLPSTYQTASMIYGLTSSNYSSYAMPISYWNWSGQSGQPTWLWGGNEYGKWYVYNPANFNVNGALKINYPGQLSTDSDVSNFNSALALQVGFWNGPSILGMGNGIIINGGWTSTNYGFQLAFDDDPTYIMGLRQRNGEGWSAWKRIPMADGTGASGTWGININGNAATASYSSSAGHATYLNTVAGNEIRIHNATGLTNGGSLWLGWAWADGDKTVTKDWYLGNFSGGGLANVYASTFNGNLNGTASSANWASVAANANWADGATYAQSVEGIYTGSGGNQVPSYIGANKTKFNMMRNFGSADIGGYMDCILMNNYSWSDVPYATGLGITKVNGYPRAMIANGPQGSWAYTTELLTSYNYSWWAVPLSGGTMTGKLQVNNLIFGYNYTNSSNAASFMFDKPGSYFTGIGANGSDNTIKFGPCNTDGTWVSGFAQHWLFQGTIRPGCIILTNDQWTGYGTADPNDLSLDKVVGRLYFKLSS